MKQLVFLILSLCISLPLWAEESAVLKPIIVTDSPEGEDITANSSLIKTSSYQNRETTLPEVLAEQPGVHVTRFGGLEDFTSISIRGSSSDQVGFYLDGIPLNSASSNDVDLSFLDLDSLDSIEIYRGATPLDLGGASSAGAVLLNSGTPKKGEHVNASVGYGSFNTVKNTVSYSQKKGKFGFLISNSFLRTDGDFSFLDDNGTPVNTADDVTTTRKNNGSQKIHPFFKLDYDFDKNTHIQWVNHFLEKTPVCQGFQLISQTQPMLIPLLILRRLKSGEILFLAICLHGKT